MSQTRGPQSAGLMCRHNSDEVVRLQSSWNVTSCSTAEVYRLTRKSCLRHQDRYALITEKGSSETSTHFSQTTRCHHSRSPQSSQATQQESEFSPRLSPFNCICKTRWWLCYWSAQKHFPVPQAFVPESFAVADSIAVILYKANSDL
jgi:hypothetical protein